MKDESKKVVKKRAPKTTTPAVRSIVSVLDVGHEKISDVIARATYRSEFILALDKVEVGAGLEVDGDFARVRQSTINFGKKVGRKFHVRQIGENGTIVIARATDPVPEGYPVGAV